MSDDKQKEPAKPATYRAPKRVPMDIGRSTPRSRKHGYEPFPSGDESWRDSDQEEDEDL